MDFYLKRFLKVEMQTIRSRGFSAKTISCKNSTRVCACLISAKLIHISHEMSVSRVETLKLVYMLHNLPHCIAVLSVADSIVRLVVQKIPHS